MRSKNFARYSMIGLGLFVSGCVSSDFNYYAPKNMEKVKNEIQVEDDFEVVWNRLIKNLSSDFFVINNVEKASRLINLSFSSQAPSEFIDCGTTYRTFKNARGTQKYKYQAANSSRFSTTDENGRAFNVNRETDLSGRINIFVAPESGKTTIRVNSRYILSIKLTYADLLGRPAGTQNATWSFNTNSPYSRSDPATGTVIKCSTNSKIEKRILLAVRPNSSGK